MIVRNGQYYLTKARFESSCDIPREISFLRTRISTTNTLHVTAMFTKLNNVATTCIGYFNKRGSGRSMYWHGGGISSRLL